MHLTVFGHQSSSNDVIKVRIFPPSSLHHFRPSYLPATAADSQQQQEQSTIPLHHLKFSGDGFDSSLPPSDYYEHTFSQRGEYLFVPYDHVVSVLPPSSGDGHLLLSCFVDASNLNPVREALATPAALFPAEAALLAALQPQHLDTSMDKSPSDLTLAQYREPHVFSAASAPGAAAPVEEKSALTGGRNRRNKKGNSEFKSWQDNLQWNLLVNSLVIPKPSAPWVLSVGRTNATLQWESSFALAEGDKTYFAFRVMVCRHNAAAATTVGGGDGTVCHNVTLDSSQVTHPTIQQQQEQHQRLYSGVVQDLQPSSAYSFALSLLYDRTESAPTLFTPVPPVMTAPLTPPSVPRASLASLSLWSGNSVVDPLVAVAELLTDAETGTPIDGKVHARLEFLWPIGESWSSIIVILVAHYVLIVRRWR